MPSQVAWFIENQVLMVTFTGVVTPEEFEGFVRQVHTHIRKANYPIIHQVIDAQQLHTLPDNEILLCFDSVKQEGIGWSIIISNGDAVLRTRITALSRHMNIRYRYVTTLEEAARILKKLDTTLPDLYVKQS